MTASDQAGDPPWLALARLELGVKETAGPASQQRIVEYLKATRVRPAMYVDETPWCAAFVCWCLERASVPSTRAALARSYLRWGVALSKPQIGCVVVLTRGASRTQGHVGFYVGARDSDVLLLGGNQGNKVSIAPHSALRVLSYRWPRMSDGQ